ncbi:Gfo/Idh/MocA family protein [Maridesulfovibrio sp.]|uniref:Gfo/Idh/MocA family protein n=1 Tax=Maridesulfovibrio sp. TaxID=2795000 RepID=UPI0039F0E0A9
MKILVLGNSGIFQKRVLPILNQCGFSKLDIASASGRAVADEYASFVGNSYTGYADAIKKTDADVAYVSSTNNLHYELAREALKRGLHTIVDKPAFMTFAQADELTELAARNNLCLAEATVYEYHPQIARTKKIFQDSGTSPTRITSVFSMPPLPENNFRYRKALGGGAVMDTGAYALSPGRIFFDKSIETLNAFILSSAEEVETSYSMLVKYEGNCSLVGHFGFDTEYRNRIEILGPELCVYFDRVFTTTPDLVNEITVISKNKQRTELVESADSFFNFFSEVAQGINSGLVSRYSEKLLQDAKAMDLLIRSVQIS